ncbi:MAG: hypothetical protein Unbinned200contig1002_7 [Prokaryotic dsDNA virus sp.]|jgi:uncharacterized membrane protein YqiK|nr:hypothetical protein [Flavobacteriaceae bacterium]QDP68306.1 MAG: hypothetical protein Unbinned200contig1002_7 [Prokaryotic dsDNA virus sp.]|tara:strand:- start:26161 stop:26454 length:294 start_codon:yes stop_codon:yes gene_type:complete
MGGFLGIGTSPQEKALREQRKRAREEAERARREAEIALAEKKAKKGAETANIQLGAEKETQEEETKSTESKKPVTTLSSDLGLGGISNKKRKTGVQL